LVQVDASAARSVGVIFPVEALVVMSRRWFALAVDASSMIVNGSRAADPVGVPVGISVGISV
jgi:hypothetical protein